MNRKSFLKKLGIGVAAIIVAPKVIAEISIPSNHTEGIIPFMLRTQGVIPHLARQGGKRYYGVIVAKSRRTGMSDMYIRYMEKLYKGHQHQNFYEFCINDKP